MSRLVMLQKSLTCQDIYNIQQEAESEKLVESRGMDLIILL